MAVRKCAYATTTTTMMMTPTFGIYLLFVQKKIRVDSALYGNVILIVILVSNIWSTHGQNVNPQQDDAADYVGPGGGVGGADGVGSNGGAVDGDRVPSSGEVMMASRLPVLNEHEPSCEELKAMWRYAIISYSSNHRHLLFGFSSLCVYIYVLF